MHTCMEVETVPKFWLPCELFSLPKKQILIAFENNKILIEITNMFFVS